MITYFCQACTFYYQELELLKGKKCPECKVEDKPRLVLGGQVMGDT